MASGFMKGGKSVFGNEKLGIGGIACFFEDVVVGVTERGNSKPGEKTVIDALKPAADALKEYSDDVYNWKVWNKASREAS